MPGPAPKKVAERRRRNKDAVAVEVVNLDELLAGEVEIPVPDPKWHDVATMVFEAQKRSGQALWMEPSDWAMLYVLCESISRDMKPQVIGLSETTGRPVRATIPLKGASLNAYLKGFQELLVAEGGRRRLRIELERQKRLDKAAGGDAVMPDVVTDRAKLFSVH